ncbi:MAG: CheB methylesterase domain-containing protein, partial [Actinomycetes bacterium]
PGRVPARVAVAGSGSIGVVAVGSSTGGPQALATLLGGLPTDFPVPLLIVQHLAVGFQSMLLRQLDSASQIPVMTAVDGMVMAPGVAYVGPDEMQLGVDRLGRIELSNGPPEGGLRPAVSYLFRSVRQAYGSRSIGVLLTGMGRDGADEMARMHEAGAITIAQDEQSSVVFGMAKEAIALGGATYVRSIVDITPTILELLRGQRGSASQDVRP